MCVWLLSCDFWLLYFKRNKDDSCRLHTVHRYFSITWLLLWNRVSTLTVTRRMMFTCKCYSGDRFLTFDWMPTSIILFISFLVESFCGFELFPAIHLNHSLINWDAVNIWLNRKKGTLEMIICGLKNDSWVKYTRQKKSSDNTELNKNTKITIQASAGHKKFTPSLPCSLPWSITAIFIFCSFRIILSRSVGLLKFQNPNRFNIVMIPLPFPYIKPNSTVWIEKWSPSEY